MEFQTLVTKVTDFINKTLFQIGETPVSLSSIFVFILLIIIAIKKPNGTMLFNPSYETVIHGGDTVIAMGKSENLKELEAVLRPREISNEMD